MDRTSKDFRLKISVRNNRLLVLIEKQRHPSIKAFAEAAGVDYNTFHRLLCLGRSPRLKSGEWSPMAMKVATYLRVEPEHIWPEHMLKIAKPVSVEVSLDELPMLQREPSRALLPAIESDDIRQRVRNSISQLPLREAQIVLMRHGFLGPEMTYAQIGEKLGVSLERARQMEMRALRRLKHAKFTSDTCEYDDVGISRNDMHTLGSAEA